MAVAAIDPGSVMILVVVLSLPVAGLIFALGAGDAFRSIGKGPMSIDQDFLQSGDSSAPVSAAMREEEIRQLVTARSYRREQRGESALDVEAEVERLLEVSRPNLAGDAALVEEVRQLVIARNARRERRGENALDVEDEVERQLRELETLGQ